MADLEAFRVHYGADLVPVPNAPRSKKRRRLAQPFLRGPVPLAWLARAHAAGGSALAAGLMLWFIAGVSGKAGPVKVGAAVRHRLGLTRDQTRRGLAALEAAGLVARVKKGRGRCAVVEIVEGSGGGICGPNG